MAELAGRPKAFRTVGNILNQNRDYGISCHGVIKSGEEIGGYNSETKKKIALLKKEGVPIKKLPNGSFVVDLRYRLFFNLFYDFLENFRPFFYKFRQYLSIQFYFGFFENVYKLTIVHAVFFAH